MKTLMFFLLFSTVAFADQWCQWDGSKGINCQSDNKGFIVINGGNVRTPSIANAKGYYKLTVTQPTLGANQEIDSEVWGLVGNQMSLTWSVKNMTAGKIDARDAAPMPLGEYYLWKALIAKGVITQQEAAQYLPQELINAYQARKRLETP